MSVRLIIDSTADMQKEDKEKFSVVPLTVLFGEEEYIDGVTITHKEFYEKLIESDIMPTTSQASPAAFEKEFIEAKEANEEAVVITISKKLSGTFQSATIAAEGFENVYIVDSHSAAVGTGILALYALKLKEKGLSAKKIVNELKNVRDNITVIALLDTLEYLKRGGRISKTVAFAGGLLSIKPVAAIENGEINILGKARGSKQGNNLLITEIEKAGGVNFEMPLLLGYTGLTDILLQKYVEDSKFIWEGKADNLTCAPIGSVIGTHAGPGAIAVAFFKNK